MKLGSLFDGSGGFPLAGAMCGIEPVWASEVEPYPIAVTKSRFPNMKHLGNVCEINGAEIEPVDIITFGSPCQDLSVAGKRAGLKHEDNGDDETTRSGLFMEAVRIIKEMREATNGRYPTYAVWENVPGAFSSNGGEDFRTVLEELIRIAEPSAVMPDVPKGGWAYADWYMGDGWSIAYRVLDAQYWGVPQRRRRIYLVADFGGERAGKILFEREGLRGHFETGRTPWQGTAADAQRCAGADDRAGTGNAVGIDGYNADVTGDKAATLGVNCGISTGRNGVIEHHPIAFTQNQRNEVRDLNDRAGALAAEPGMKQQTFVAVPMRIVEAAGFKELNSAKARSDGYGYEVSPTLAADKHDATVCYSFDALASNSMKSSNPHSGYREVEIAKTLDTTDPNPSKNQGGIAIVERHLFENYSQDARYRDPLDVCPMLSAQLGTGGNNQPLVTKATIPIHDQATRFSGKRGDKTDGKGNGLGIGDPADPMNTLTSGDRHAVVYALDRASFNQGINAQYDFEITDSGINSTIVAKGPSAVAYAIGNGQVDQTGLHDIPGALNCMHDQQAVLINNGNAAYVDTTHADDVVRLDKTVAPLQARDYKGGKLVQTRYIVRRLTPTECARLQGFPDEWGHPNQKDDFTEEEYRFWLDAKNTHAAINGKAVKEYTKQQMLAWYNKLHTDSAEYKMWGNGIALPTALYVMQGIAEEVEVQNDGRNME